MFKTTAIDTLKQDKKCQACWYMILSTMSGSTTAITAIIVLFAAAPLAATQAQAGGWHHGWVGGHHGWVGGHHGWGWGHHGWGR
jgi:hypothetical protein